MSAEGFDAGSIFVQVVPSFRDTQRIIGAESKKFGDQLEKDLSQGLERGAEKGAKKVGDKLKNVIGDELGKEAGKAGEKAADNYAGEFRTKLTSALRSMERELKPIEINTGSTKALAELERLKAKIKELGDAKIEPGMSTTKIRKDMDDLLRDIHALGKDAEIEVKADTKAATRAVTAFKKYVDSLDPEVEVKVKVDRKVADRELGSFEALFRAKMKSAASALGDNVNGELTKIKADLKSLGDSEIGIDISAGDAMAQLEAVHLELAQINGTTATADVRVNSGKALAELTAVSKEVDHLDKKTKEVTKGPGLIDKLLGGSGAAGGRGQEVANAFRSFNGILLTAVTIGPALIPILAGIGGGLAALAPLALAGASGIGVLALAFSGVGAAVTAMGAAQSKSAKDTVAAARTMRNASQGVADAELSLKRARRDAAQAGVDAAKQVAQAEEDAASRNEQAQRRVQDARKSAAAAIESALKRQQQAEESLAGAQRDAQRAQEDLAKARTQAQKDLSDTADRTKQNALDIRQATIDVFNATVANNAVQADPGSTNLEKDQSDINLKQTQLRLEELRKTQKDLADQKKKTDKTGINGTDGVVAAQQRLNDALLAQKKAQDDVAASAKDLRAAQVDGQQAVLDALKQQRDAATQGSDAIAAAEENRKRVAQSSADSIKDAQKGLTRAQQSYADALYDTGEQGSIAMQKVRDAMSKLGPEAQAFAKFIFGLRDSFYQLRSVAAAGVLPGVTELLQTLITTYGPGFTKFIASISAVLGDLAVQLGKSLTGPAWKGFFDAFAGAGPTLLKEFGQTLILWLEASATFLQLAIPLALQFSGALLNMAKHASEFMKSSKGQKVWSDFFRYAAKIGPEVKDFFIGLGSAIINIAKALAPIGESVMNILTHIFDFIGAMDPKTLQLIVVGILALAIAFQIASAAVFLLSAAASFIEAPLALVVAAIVLVAAGLYLLYTRSETAHKIIDAVFHAIGDAAVWLWENALKPFFKFVLWYWKLLYTGIAWAWTNVIWPALKAFGTFVGWLWTNVLGPVFGFIGKAFKVMADLFLWAWTNILWPVFKVFAKIGWELYTLTLKVAFDLISAAFTALGRAFEWTWNHIIKPLFDVFMKFIGNDLVSAFKSAVGFIKKHWDTIKEIVMAPISFVIDVVINKGLIAGFNKLADFFHMDKVAEIPWPPASASAPSKNNTGGHAPGFATGGVYPGYTPGRDIGFIGVSGGEAIMRPEWTRAMQELDPSYIDEANKRARQGGVGGVKRFLGGFMNGGEVGGSVGNFSKINWRGKTLDVYTARMLEAAEKLAHQSIRITQGSYSTSVAASGSTHAGGGAFDLHWPGGALGNALVAALRTVGTASWHRDPSQGNWADHIHGIAIGDPTASPAAQSQVRDYYNGGDGLGHKDNGPQVTKDPSLLQRLLGAAGGLVDWASDAIGDPIKYLRGLVTDKIGQMTEKFGDSNLTQFLGKIPEKLISGMVSKIKGFNPFDGGDTGSSDLKGMAKEMLNGYGWGSQWGSFDWLVNKESSWNPTAANPTSSAYGLMQFLDGTWANGRTNDPREQLRQGMDYIKRRYGGPDAAKAFHEQHGWYKDGGVVPDDASSLFSTPTDLYDTGGRIPEGLSQVLNLTGADEHAAVFTTDQWQRLQTGGGGDTYIQVPMQPTNSTPEAVADAIAFEQRKNRHSGRYARSGAPR